MHTLLTTNGMTTDQELTSVKKKKSENAFISTVSEKKLTPHFVNIFSILDSIRKLAITVIFVQSNNTLT